MTSPAAALAALIADETRYVHFSRSPLAREFLESKSQLGGRAAECGDKPNGLWFSVEGRDDGWLEWCKAESFSLDALAYENEITFAATARLLTLSNETDIDSFTKEYGREPAWVRRISYGGKGYAIDWPLIAAKYDAIIIAPYIWSRRLEDHCHWYYSWDCACGCVWNTEAVAALRARSPR